MRRLCLAGPLAVVAAWVVIGAAWALNSDWFAFTRHAFSDLGGPRSCCPGLYNYGLMAVGVLVAAYGACVAALAATRPGIVGGGYMALAGVFLALIGVFPTGTRPHVFVSTWFFVQADLALTLASVDAVLGGYRLGKPALALSLAAFPVAGLVEAAVGWPSAAVLEAYGIIVIDAVVLALTPYYYRAPVSPRRPSG